MKKNLKKTLENLCPMDDTFFHKLAEQKSFCEELLQVILQKPNLKVVENIPQKSMRNIKGRSVIVDVLCKDSFGDYFDVEVQQMEENCQKRMRYYGANVDTYISEKGVDFAKLPDVYMVYISATDPFLKGRTIYHIERRICETGEIVENGFHEIYVNTKIHDGSNIAQLMEIFTSPQIPENKKFPKICQTIRYYKEGKGQREMSKVMEKYAKEYAEEYAKGVVLNMLQRDIEIEVISQCTKISKEKIIQIQKEMLQSV